MADGPTASSSFSWLLAWLVLFLLVIAIWIGRTNGPQTGNAKAPVIESTNLRAMVASESEVPDDTDRSRKFLTTIRRPDGPPKIELDQADPQGRTGSVACSTCHSVRTPNFANTPKDLDQFHQDMPMAHGTLTCYSCHNPDDTDTLRLADSTAVEYPDVMTMCAQCHGPQMKDYEHGAHGGMNGHWDLSRGPRTRNNCIDCHDPHVPKFPSMKPTFKPRDRFLDSSDGHGGTVEHGQGRQLETDHE